MALADNLVTYWKFDESSGNAADSVGSVTLTNYNSVAYSSAKINNGADFGSSNNTTKQLTNTSIGAAGLTFSAGNAKSISFWIYANATPDDFSRWLDWRKSGGSGGEMTFNYDKTTNTLNIYTNGGTGLTAVSFTMANSTWYHFVLTVDASNNTELYINGTSVGTGTWGTAGASANFTQINSANGNTSGAFGGPFKIDEFGVWQRELTSGEVTQLYNSGNGLAYPFATTYNQAVTATASITGAMIKGLSKTLTATATGNASVLKQMAVALSASTAVTASLVKQLAIELVSTATTVATMTAIRVFLVTIEAVSTVTSSMTKIPGKLLSATASITAEITKLSMLARTLEVTASVTGSVLKSVSKAITATSTVTASITKVPSKILSAVATVTSSIGTIQAKVLTVTTTVTASIQEARAKVLEATTTVTASVDKTVGKTLTAVLSVVAKVIAPFWRIKYPSHGDAEDYNKKYDD